MVNPPYSGSRARVVFSAGLGYIAEALKSEGFEYDVLDMSLGYAYKHLRMRIEQFKPELVGVSMMSYRYKDTYGILAKVKKDFPGIGIVAGNAHISLLRQEALAECPHIDFGIVLEGEGAIVDLCKGKAIESIKGLIYRDSGGAVVYNGDRPFIQDLDSLPFPKYEKFELGRSINKTVNTLSIVSSRGCPFECSYCIVDRVVGTSYRVRSPQNIMDELAYWYEKGYRRFNFGDDNFTLIKERVYSLCELIVKSRMKDLRLSCDNGIRADRADRDLLKYMREAGFYRFAIGVESGNNSVLRNLKKKEDIETIKRVIRDAVDLGYEVALFLVVGSPGETWNELKDSFRIALDYPIDMAHFSNIVPYPHTELFRWVEKHGRFLRAPKDYLNDCPVLDNDPVFETSDMPLEERRKALREAFAIMRKSICRSAEKKLAHLGFMGKIIAFIYASKLIQDVIIRRKIFSKILYRFSDLCFSLQKKRS